MRTVACMMVVDLACELGVFTRLATRPHSSGELARCLGATEVPLTSLLDACVGVGLLSLDRGEYANRPIAEAHLVVGRPQYVGDLFRVFAAEAGQWQGLRALVLGKDAEDGGDELDARRFTKAMHALGTLGEAEALAQSVDLAGRRDLVDVGCGSGIYSLTLCSRYPKLRATLLDRPEVLEVTRENVAESGLSERVTLVPGDFLRDSYGGARDVVLLSDVLYLSDEECVAMLREAYRALVPGGLVVIRGYYPDPRNNRSAFAALFDLDRLLWDDARRPLPASRAIAWLSEVGFRNARSFALTELSTRIVAEK